MQHRSRMGAALGSRDRLPRRHRRQSAFDCAPRSAGSRMLHRMLRAGARCVGDAAAGARVCNGYAKIYPSPSSMAVASTVWRRATGRRNAVNRRDVYVAVNQDTVRSNVQGRGLLGVLLRPMLPGRGGNWHLVAPTAVVPHLATNKIGWKRLQLSQRATAIEDEEDAGGEVAVASARRSPHPTPPSARNDPLLLDPNHRISHMLIRQMHAMSIVQKTQTNGRHTSTT